MRQENNILKLSKQPLLQYSLLIIAAILCSCQGNKVKISGRFIVDNETKVYLEEVTSTNDKIIDSVVLDKEGNFSFTLKNAKKSPALYNVIYNWERIPLFLAQGDNISINSMGSVAKNYTVEGSEESELIRKFYQPYVRGMQELDRIANLYAASDISDEDRKGLAKEYHDEYNHIKQEQLRFIIENKSSLAAVYALYQRLPNDSYLFNGKSDVIYYRTVADALAEKYPESNYHKKLLKDIDNFDKINALNSNMSESGYPDLELNDMYGKKVRLSSLDGKVILLDFWSAEIGNGNVANAELKELYKEYKDQGFEIYQVGIDSSKSIWISAIQEQKLPWISVSDLRGNRSPILGSYNITRLPSNFLISKDGELVVRDIYGDNLTKYIEQELAK